MFRLIDRHRRRPLPILHFDVSLEVAHQVGMQLKHPHVHMQAQGIEEVSHPRAIQWLVQHFHLH